MRHTDPYEDEDKAILAKLKGDPAMTATTDNISQALKALKALNAALADEWIETHNDEPDHD